MIVPDSEDGGRRACPAQPLRTSVNHYAAKPPRVRDRRIDGPAFGMLTMGARGATQVRGKDGVHPEIDRSKQFVK